MIHEVGLVIMTILSQFNRYTFIRYLISPFYYIISCPLLRLQYRPRLNHANDLLIVGKDIQLVLSIVGTPYISHYRACTCALEC